MESEQSLAVFDMPTCHRRTVGPSQFRKKRAAEYVSGLCGMQGTTSNAPFQDHVLLWTKANKGWLCHGGW
jgi:hypothetical protein